MNDRSIVTVAGVCFTTVSLGAAVIALPPPAAVVGNVVFRAASSSTHVPEKSGCGDCPATSVTTARSVSAAMTRRGDVMAILRASLCSQGRSGINAQRAHAGNPRGQQGDDKDESR